MNTHLHMLEAYTNLLRDRLYALIRIMLERIIDSESAANEAAL